MHMKKMIPVFHSCKKKNIMILIFTALSLGSIGIYKERETR